MKLRDQDVPHKSYSHPDLKAKKISKRSRNEPTPILLRFGSYYFKSGVYPRGVNQIPLGSIKGLGSIPELANTGEQKE